MLSLLISFEVSMSVSFCLPVSGGQMLGLDLDLCNRLYRLSDGWDIMLFILHNNDRPFVSKLNNNIGIVLQQVN